MLCRAVLLVFEIQPRRARLPSQGSLGGHGLLRILEAPPWYCPSVERCTRLDFSGGTTFLQGRQNRPRGRWHTFARRAWETGVMPGCNIRDIARQLSPIRDHMSSPPDCCPFRNSLSKGAIFEALLHRGKCLIYEKGVATRVFRILLTGIVFNRLVKVFRTRCGGAGGRPRPRTMRPAAPLELRINFSIPGSRPLPNLDLSDRLWLDLAGCTSPFSIIPSCSSSPS